MKKPTSRHASRTCRATCAAPAHVCVKVAREIRARARTQHPSPLYLLVRAREVDRRYRHYCPDDVLRMTFFVCFHVSCIFEKH